MAHSRSAWKRVRQNETRRARNRGVRSRLRTELKSLLGALKAGDAAKARAQYLATVVLLDKAAICGIIHRNKAARHKSRLSSRLAAIGKKTG